MSPGDHDLLRCYAENAPGAQAAFATLTSRHVNLVYSVARRHVRSTHLAEEIAQSVFVDLARNARRIDPKTPLLAWLHLVSRRTAIDVVRRESRRQAREAAAATLADMKTPSPWSAVEPLLDEAVESLPAADRSAILMRFFENKSLREVGVALGSSEDAAQKRVSRAIEQLRGFFARRGVTVTAAGLTADLSVRAIEAAPAALGATIATSKAITLAAGAMQTIIMTTVQKTLVATALTLVLGGVAFQGYRLTQQQREIDTLRQSTDHLAARVRDARQKNESAARASLVHSASAPTAAPAVDPALHQEATALLERLRRVQELLNQHPERTIPEMALLTQADWFERARRAKLDSREDIAELFMAARGLSKAKFAAYMMEAAAGYLKAHNNQMPAQARDLLPFFTLAGVTEAMLDRYAVRYTGSYADVPAPERSATFVEITSPDEQRDQRIYVGPGGARLRDFKTFTEEAAYALRVYAATNSGAAPASLNQLLPFFNPPLSPARQIAFLQSGAAHLPKP
jgi:RNA polymerase sigma factor (sigma-70 family)